jgi:hypothetical protein
VGVDLPSYEKLPYSASREDAYDAMFSEAFAKSLTYTDHDSLPTEEMHSLIMSFAVLYIYDRNAEIESKVSGFEISGDTATIKLTEFTYFMGGNDLGRNPDPTEENGKIKLVRADGKWLIYGFEPGERTR